RRLLRMDATFGGAAARRTVRGAGCRVLGGGGRGHGEARPPRARGPAAGPARAPAEVHRAAGAAWGVLATDHRRAAGGHGARPACQPELPASLGSRSGSPLCRCRRTCGDRNRAPRRVLPVAVPVDAVAAARQAVLPVLSGSFPRVVTTRRRRRAPAGPCAEP